MSKDKYEKLPEKNYKTQLANALVEELKKLNNENNFIDFIEKFHTAMYINETIGNDEKDYGFSVNNNGVAIKNSNAKETEKLFDNIRLGLSNIVNNEENLRDETIELLTKYIGNAINFNKNRKALICQGELKNMFRNLKTKTETLWKSSPLNPANKK